MTFLYFSDIFITTTFDDKSARTRGGALGYISGCDRLFLFFMIGGAERGKGAGAGTDNRSI